MTPYEIRIAPAAERAFERIEAGARRTLVSVVQGIAELAAVAPLEVPPWLRGPNVRPPLIQMELAGYRLAYELIPGQRAVRVVGVEGRA